MLIVPNVYLSLSIFDTEVYAADKSVSEKLTDFMLPMLGGEKNSNSENDNTFKNFASELTSNLTRNGIELVDVVQEVGSDLLFKPTRSFWDVVKDTYKTVANAEWSYATQNSFVYNIPDVKPKGFHNIYKSTVGVEDLRNYFLTITFDSDHSKLYVEGNKVRDYQFSLERGGQEEPDRLFVSSVTDVSMSFKMLNNNTDIKLYNVSSVNPVHMGTLKGYIDDRAQQIDKIYSGGPFDDSNIEQRYSSMSSNIETFFPGSTDDKEQEKVYTINNTYIDNSVINDSPVTYQDLVDNKDDVVKESDSEFPDSDNSGGFPWSALLDLIGTIVNAISDLGQAILGIADTLLSGLLELFNDAFIPSDGFFTDNFTDIKSEVDDKVPDFNELSFVDDLKSSSGSSELVGFDVNIPTFGGHNVQIIDKDIVAQFAPKVKTWISMLLYFLTSIVLYKRVSRVVNE